MTFTALAKSSGIAIEPTRGRSREGYPVCRITHYNNDDTPLGNAYLGVLIEGKPHVWCDQLDSNTIYHAKRAKTVV